MDPPKPTFPALDQGLAERVDSLATWLNEIEARLSATELATGDERTAKELRKALEALAKHDPKLEKRVTDHVAVLADRLETLASTISQTAAALAAKDGEIRGLRRELEGAERKIEALGGDSGRGVDAREIARLRAMIDAVAAQRPVRASDSRVDELGSRIRLLADRVDSMGATVAATAATLGRREGDLATLRERLDHGASQIEDVTAELRRLHREGDLVARLDGLHASVAVVNGGLAAREDEAAALRARIDEAYSRVGTVVTELQRALGGLSTQVAALATLPEATAAALEGRTAELDGRIDAVGQRLETVGAQVASGVREIEERSRDLAMLHGELDTHRSYVDSLVAAVRAELAALPDPSAPDPELDARLTGLAADVAAVATRLDEIAADAASRVAASVSRASVLEDALGELSTRLDSVEQEREAATAQLKRADEMWLEERDWVRRQLERLASAHEEAAETSGGVGDELAALRARLDEAAAGRAAVAEEIARVSHALDSERDSLQARLDDLAAAVADVGAQDASDQLAALAGRLDGLERTGAAVASELARATAVWASEIDSLGERLAGMDPGAPQDASLRLDETERIVGALAARLEKLEGDGGASSSELASAAEAWASERALLTERIEDVSGKLARVESAAQSAAAAAAVAAAGNPDDVAELRALVDGLRLRIASGEKERAELTNVRDVGTRLDDLARRLETVELAGPVTIVPNAESPLTGDGRFRLELRALELRMEHAEAAARENREAVLTQLERLASRVEWRLQRLEAAQEEPHTEPEDTGARVVPIRGGADQ